MKLLALLNAIPGNEWKTYVGGVCTILVGLGGLVSWLLDEKGASAIEPMEAIGLITVGLTALGIGHKVDKSRDEVRKSRDTDLFLEG